jgi:hypothetical protein
MCHHRQDGLFFTLYVMLHRELCLVSTPSEENLATWLINSERTSSPSLLTRHQISGAHFTLPAVWRYALPVKVDRTSHQEVGECF